MQGSPDSAILDIFACGIRNTGNFVCGIRNPGLVESGIQLKESRISLTVAIWNPSSTDKESEIQYLKSRIHDMESRIQDCLAFPYMRFCQMTMVLCNRYKYLRI